MRLLGVGVSGFERPAHQLGLWDTPDPKDANLLTAMDTLRERYGKNSIMRLSDLKYKKSEGTPNLRKKADQGEE